MSTPFPHARAPTADPQHRNLQYYQYYNHGEGTGEEKPVFDTASSGAYADTYRNQAEPRDEGFLEGLAWGSWTGDGLDGGGWGAWDDWRDEDPLEEGGVSAFAGQPLWAGEGQQAGGRKLQDLGSGVNRWGSWGQEGERDYDETCYVKMEKVTPVAQVMRLELARLKKCFGAVSIKTGRWGEVAEGEALAKAKAMDDKIKTCFTVSQGISDQYIYRSLYDLQAYHCLKHIPREQILFIETDDLRDRPEEIMLMVHRHIGISEFEYPSLGQDAIMEELEKKYPDFEKRTGWRLDSAYKEEMPEDLAKELREFFRPHMQMFARLVGQSFGTWAVDDKDKKEAMVGASERPTELFEEEFAKAVIARAELKAASRVAVDKRDASGGAPAGDNKR
eukprot:jgi/Undpi1/14244/HiC_scaffold_9.g03893.m1